MESSGLGKIRLDPEVQKIYVKPSPATLHNQTADWSRIQDELAAVAGDIDPTLEAIQNLAELGEAVDDGVTVVIAGNHIVSVEAGNTTERTFGMAFDIGTTTIVGALMNLVTGDEIAVASGLNDQHVYGGDLIRRSFQPLLTPYQQQLDNSDCRYCPLQMSGLPRTWQVT